jgi:disulfide oxidoreductase YuzD
MISIVTENGLNCFDEYHFKHWLGNNHGADLRHLLDVIQDDEYSYPVIEKPVETEPIGFGYSNINIG